MIGATSLWSLGQTSFLQILQQVAELLNMHGLPLVRGRNGPSWIHVKMLFKPLSKIRNSMNNLQRAYLPNNSLSYQDPHVFSQPARLLPELEWNDRRNAVVVEQCLSKPWCVV